MSTLDWNQVNLVTGPEEGVERPGREQVAGLVRDMLEALGEDPNRQGLQRTPERVARMYEELLAGYRTDPVAMVNDAIFDSEHQGIVLVRDIPFYSLCEHHLLPFFGHVHVAYVPDGRVLGLSKIPRTVEMYARRLQLQERMTDQIASFIWDIVSPRAVAVIVEGHHMCASMRGAKTPEARMVTEAMLGEFRTDEALREELTAQLKRSDRS